jgi:hypothetical protein
MIIEDDRPDLIEHARQEKATNVTKIDISSPKAAEIAVNPLEPTIFHERWWLDIATDGRCKFSEVVEKGKVVGRMPYVLKENRKLSIIDMPPLTHFLGPATVDGKAKENTRFLRRLDITRALIEQLPKVSSTYIKCHRGVSDILAFQNQAFRSSVQFTHEISPQPIQDVWAGMRDKGRNGIRIARNSLTVYRDVTSDEFIQAYGRNLESLGHKNYMNMSLAARIIESTLVRSRGMLVGARNAKGELLAAIFCVWDHGSYYYLMSTRTIDAHRGATSLLLWEAISDAMQKGLIFDFDGIVDEGSARLAANFSGTVAPRYIGTRETRGMHIMRALQSVRQLPNFFCR